MKILFIGDVIGEPGRKTVARQVPRLVRERGVDCVIANAENAAGGFGVTPDVARELFAAGVHVLTSGNHIRSEERRVGEEGRSRGAPDHLKKKKRREIGGDSGLEERQEQEIHCKVQNDIPGTCQGRDKTLAITYSSDRPSLFMKCE